MYRNGRASKNVPIHSGGPDYWRFFRLCSMPSGLVGHHKVPLMHPKATICKQLLMQMYGFH